MNLPSIQEMTNKEKELFNQIIDEQVQLMGLESERDEVTIENLLIDFFDEESETYDNFEKLLVETEIAEELLDTTYMQEDT
ncbi:hypothetical protein [Lederbergia lenta]|uniref:Uncharacterized protein n=2 Tax=Lederbergia lenta TaxID=1467 RepID=A0A2X4WI90_LEDLE|nr:hypothetical protein [Lederbergia lenta]MEC2323119.1 hypothetical protein [Lederbergia lenta]SQI62763.1 Uncharacterised protein [Lederbergia lenta]